MTICQTVIKTQFKTICDVKLNVKWGSLLFQNMNPPHLLFAVKLIPLEEIIEGKLVRDAMNACRGVVTLILNFDIKLR
jgi:hypothetical protein